MDSARPSDDAHSKAADPKAADPGVPWGDLARPPLDEAGLRRALTGPAGPCAALTVTASMPSTNSALVATAADRADWTVLVTEHQVQGRGRLGRAWQTPPRAALTFSVLLRPTAVPSQSWAWAGLLMGLALTRVLRAQAGLDAALKWPNDVLVRPLPHGPRLKVAGILAELVPGDRPALVVGAGLNVSTTRADLPVATATSLALEHAATTDRTLLLKAVLREFRAIDDAWRAAGGVRAGLADQVRQACCTLGEQVTVQVPGGSGILGTAEGLDDDGRLLVRVGDRTEAVAAGDVVHVRAGVADE